MSSLVRGGHFMSKPMPFTITLLEADGDPSFR